MTDNPEEKDKNEETDETGDTEETEEVSEEITEEPTDEGAAEEAPAEESEEGPAEEAATEEEAPIEEAAVEEEVPAEVVAKPKKEPKPKKEKKEKVKSDGPNYRRQWFWIFITLIVLFALAYTPWRYTSSPEACAQCHSMKQYYDSYKKSWHGKNEVPCDYCHVRPGAFAYYTYRIGFYREIYAEMFHKDLAPWGATAPGESSCTRSSCHSLNRLSSTSGNIKVSHVVHVKVVEKKYGKACSYCHAGASHAGIKGLGNQLPPRKQCFDCHKDKAKQCDYCHTIKYTPGTVTAPHF